MEKLRVFLSDWQVLFREGIHFILSGEEGMEVIGEETENARALAFIEENLPDVAILNASEGDPNGIEVTRQIKQNMPEVAVILIMDSDNEEQLFLAMKKGAKACLTKAVDPEVMVATIQKIAQGVLPISEVLLKPEIASRTIDEFETLSSIGEPLAGLLPHLTSRETEILRHIANGDSKEQVAGTLEISEETINHQLEAIVLKLVANDHNRMLIEATQSSLPSVARVSFNGKPGDEYITKEEFTAFKESLKEHLQSPSKETK
ncbi:response regulator [Chloroflexota bacterium]